MFNFFKKKNKEQKINNEKKDYEIELTASVLGYEIARSDGEISELELNVMLSEIKKIALEVDKSEEEILNLIEHYSQDSVSFYEFIEDINREYTKENKLELLRFLWDVAYADSILEVNEERLVRRIANLIHIKDIEVLKIKDSSKNKG
jgi:uncharacterized tellurite resistance protein B-like protein